MMQGANINLVSLVCFMLLSSSGSLALARTLLSETHENGKNIFILAGQSNMAGRGHDVNHTNPPECRPDPNILMLDPHLNWVKAVDPLHKDIDVGKPVDIGPGMPFAHRILAKDPSFGTIGLVPCAKGETNISMWEKGTPLYNRTVDRARAALVDGGRIRALLWYQGESDTTKKSNADAYKGRLEKFIFDIRSDLNQPDLPVIMVAIMSSALSPKAKEEYAVQVREAQLQTKISNVVTIDAEGAKMNTGDVWHLSMDGSIQVGTKLADTFLEMIDISWPMPSSA